MQVSFTQDEIAAVAMPRKTQGATTESIRGIASLEAAQPGDISFLGNPKYRSSVASTRASVVLLPPDYSGDPGPNQTYMTVDNPSIALARLCSRIEQALWPAPKPGIHPSAVVAPDATVCATATVGPLCVIEPGVVVAAECVVGRRVRLHPGVVVGSDGFGYELASGRHEKVPQVGSVLIGDDVEIGANSTIDRARFGRTTVGEGTKIDNLVQVGHNVVIGKHCLICALAGVSGSTTLGDYVVLGGQAGLMGHLTLGNGAKVGAQAGVNNDIPAGVSVRGTPSMPYMVEQRMTVLRNRLPELFKRVEKLEEHLGME